jgi:hypothetical protein
MVIRRTGSLETIVAGDASFGTGKNGTSRFGIVIFVGGAIVDAHAIGGTRVQQSASEAEDQAQNHAANMGIVVDEQIASILGHKQPKWKVAVLGDNLTAIHHAEHGLAQSPFTASKSVKKATVVDIGWNHQMTKDGVTRHKYIDTDRMVMADGLTKVLGYDKHAKFVEVMRDPGRYVLEVLRPVLGEPQSRGCRAVVTDVDRTSVDSRSGSCVVECVGEDVDG